MDRPVPDHIDSVFAALADSTRREVVRCLADDGPATATQLAGRIPVTRQAITKHLVALGEAGLVTTERCGRELRYRLTPRPLHEAVSWIAVVGAQWDDRLDALRTYMSGGTRSSARRTPGFR
jgi:DNA-binding transcriptional ArsR family regulator